jgi:gliding motility-associated-like protein
MKKILILVLFCSSFYGFGQYTLIPDANFEKALINLGIDSGNVDGQVLTSNISGIKSLGVFSRGIADLTGIENFSSLTSLSCEANKLTSLDVSKNLALNTLICFDNQITKLDISKNTALTTLGCANNQITSLDISKNIHLVGLYCTNNKLTTLNLKNGINNQMIVVDFKSNPNLNCIQVDNKIYSDTNWLMYKDITASYSENCNTSINAPTITATGNLTYCPLSQTKIVSTVTITHDIADPITQAVYIQIASGYVYGTDQLLLTNTAAHPTITASWNATEGKLTLSSPIAGTAVNYSEFEAAIKDVAYYNSSPNPSGTRNFSISLGNGQANYLPRNGHYYEYVSSLSITWSSAKTAAALKTFYGLQGYLATLTAADEAQLAGKQAPGTGWIGGTDEAVEGVWRWVTGPEGLANGGAGVVFWNGLANGSTPNFAFWNSNEPNQSGNEDYAHITAPGIGIPGSWNDLSNTGAASGAYQPQGYIVEYGGMSGDSTLQLSASTTLSIGGQITATTPASNCGPGSVTLRATASSGTINWYNTNTGGTALGTGTNYTTPTLSSTTSFYVATSDCTERTEIKATILPLPNYPSSTTSVSYCLNEIAIPLVATADTNSTLNWYTAASGGTPSATSPTPTTSSSGITKFYVSQTNTLTGCEGPRTEITVTVNSLPTTPSVTAISYCLNSSATPLSATADTNHTLNWYTTASGGTPSATSPTPTTTSAGITKFYVSQTNTLTGCEGLRAEITITVNSLPTAPSVTAIYYCLNNTAFPLSATADANSTLNWYTVNSGGTSSSTGSTPITSSSGITKFYVSQTNTLTACEGPRAEIIVTVNALPTVNDITITQCDTDLISDGKTSFNLTVNNSLISSNYANETFKYYTSLNGAINDTATNLITNELAFQNTIPTSMDIWTRVSNSFGCHSVSKITLKVPTTNFNPSSNYPFTVCDDFLDTNGNNTANNSDTDGIASFDFSSTRATILSQLPSSTQNYTINYYKNQTDALSQLNAITDISNYRNIGYPNAQNIWVRIETDLDNSCIGLGPYITLNVEKLPNIELNSTNLICSNIPTFFVTLDAGFLSNSTVSNFSYSWKKNGASLNTTTPTLGVNSEGNYAVDVTNSAGCSRTRTIQVTASNLATITSIDIVDLVDINTVMVNTTGPGDYEYSMDYLNGIWQDSNFFSNVPGGIHQVFVNDKNGCGLVSKEITVLSIPKFFTPNNDGYNDFWTVKGMISYPTSELRIFDRYGKLIKELTPNSLGWDGTFNGQELPASDYWFVFKLDTISSEKRGHFSLIR